jgi:hypothetical protein
VVCSGIPPPEPAQISAGSRNRVFTRGTKTKMGGNDAFGRHCGQFSVGCGIGIGILTVEIRRGAHAAFHAVCVASLLLCEHGLRVNKQQRGVHK